MRWKNPNRVFFLVFGGAFLLMSTVRLVNFSHEREDIWWTPREQKVGLADAGGRVEIYVRGIRFDDLVSTGRITIRDDSGTTPIAVGDVGIRFNNRDKVRAQRLPGLVGNGMTAGAAGVLFLLGLIGLVPPPREREEMGGG